MHLASDVDLALVQWGERLFFPRNRLVRNAGPSRLAGNPANHHASLIRARIEATVVRRATQVMLRITGGGRGMNAIGAHLRYITKDGVLGIEDERGETERGMESLFEIAEDWRFGGSVIENVSNRREALNLTLSMPRGTDPQAVHRAAREFAFAELTPHKYVFVLHDHQANPHVHLVARRESKFGGRIRISPADLYRWRETFAEKLRGLGIDAIATGRLSRGETRRHEPLWRIRAREAGRLEIDPPCHVESIGSQRMHLMAAQAWRGIAAALDASTERSDRSLAREVRRFVNGMPSRDLLGRDGAERGPERTLVRSIEPSR